MLLGLSTVRCILPSRIRTTVQEQAMGGSFDRNTSPRAEDGMRCHAAGSGHMVVKHTIISVILRDESEETSLTGRWQDVKSKSKMEE